jgi:hypothetical protein
MRSDSVWIAGGALLATFLVAGCAGEGSVTDPLGPYAAIQQEIFNPRCTSSSCHSAASRAGDLSLIDGQSYDQLVNVEPDNAAARAAGLLRVVPSDPEQSFLMRKTTGVLGPGEGSPMPLSASPLSPDQIEMIRSWIADGALPDPPPTG